MSSFAIDLLVDVRSRFVRQPLGDNVAHIDDNQLNDRDVSVRRHERRLVHCPSMT
jgi:hypothetical protein